MRYIKLLAPSNELLRDLKSNRPSIRSSRKSSPNFSEFKSDLVKNEVNTNFLSDLKQNKTGTTGEINISTGETFAVQFLSPIISKFRKIYPDVKIKISSSHIRELIKSNKKIDGLVPKEVLGFFKFIT